MGLSLTNTLSNACFIAQVPIMGFFLSLAAPQGYQFGKVGSHSFCSRIIPSLPLEDRSEVPLGDSGCFISPWLLLQKVGGILFGELQVSKF